MFKISYNHVLAWQYANDMVDKVDAEIAKVLQPGFSKAVTLGRSPNTFQVNVMVVVTVEHVIILMRNVVIL